MRLIDADQLGIGKETRSVFIEKAYADGWNSAIDIINQAETVDAAPVVHGKWELCFEDWRKQLEGDKCSICGFEHYGTCIRSYNYCPSCGAKMDLEEQNNA